MGVCLSFTMYRVYDTRVSKMATFYSPRTLNSLDEEDNAEIYHKCVMFGVRKLRCGLQRSIDDMTMTSITVIQHMSMTDKNNEQPSYAYALRGKNLKEDQIPND